VVEVGVRNQEHVGGERPRIGLSVRVFLEERIEEQRDVLRLDLEGGVPEVREVHDGRYRLV